MSVVRRYASFVTGSLLIWCPDLPAQVAGREVVATETVRIRVPQLTVTRPGRNRFVAQLENRVQQFVTIGLDLRSIPGLWLRNHQRQVFFTLAPRETRAVDTHYEFPHLMSDSRLRIRFAYAVVDQAGITRLGKPLFETFLEVGRDNPAIDYDLSQFELRATEHFQIRYYVDSLAERKIDEIAAEREAAFRQISGAIGVDHRDPIRIFLFPDAASKTAETGHTGNGWAFGNNLVEIYNDRVRLDPYHELTHVLARHVGDPPAMFNEGLAVHMAESMGADALSGLGSPGRSVDEVSADNHRRGALFPLEQLMTFTEIGSAASRPAIAYPQAASVVGFLIQTYGMERTLDAYGTLADTGQQGLQRNLESFRKIFGKTLAEVEAEWLTSLKRPRGTPRE